MDDRDLFGVALPQLDSNKQSPIDSESHTPAESLKHSEIKYMERLERLYAAQVPQPRDVETLFRHRGWLPDRQRVFEALVAMKAPESRLRRFEGCGADCMVEVERKSGKVRFRAFYCGDRGCKPCMRARATRAAAILRTWAKGQPLWHVVLTRRTDGANHKHALDHLTSSFSKVRQSLLWRTAVKAGAAVVESKVGKGSNKLHLHLHCLVVGDEMNKFALSKAWRRASGGSFIVHVGKVLDHEKQIAYVCSYIGKGLDASVYRRPDLLLDALTALRGRRLFCTFGEWWGRERELESEEGGDWRMVGRLHVVTHAAVRGDDWAVGIFRSARIAVGVMRGLPCFWPIEDDA